VEFLVMHFNVPGTMFPILAAWPHGAAVLWVGNKRCGSNPKTRSQEYGRNENAIAGHGDFPLRKIEKFSEPKDDSRSKIRWYQRSFCLLAYIDCFFSA
jgi:hypothetical protein